MTREELVKQKAHSLGQKYFPDGNNVWARANFEAQWVSEACKEMAEWEHKRLVDMAVKWLVMNASDYAISTTDDEDNCVVSLDMVEDFRKAMEE